ncbi:MAG: DUF4760 domain-containing protein [Pseudomonadota bacterium]
MGALISLLATGFAFILGGGFGTNIPASVFAGVTGLFINQALRLGSEERQRAIEFIRLFDEGDHSPKNDIKVFGEKIAEFGDITTDRAKDIYFSSEPCEAAFRAPLGRTLNFIEILGICVRNGDMNERIVQGFYIGLVCRAYSAAEPFLPALRNVDEDETHPVSQKSRPDLFVNAQWLYERWKPLYEVSDTA